MQTEVEMFFARISWEVILFLVKSWQEWSDKNINIMTTNNKTSFNWHSTKH